MFLSGQALLHPEIQEMKEIHRFSEKKKSPFIFLSPKKQQIPVAN